MLQRRAEGIRRSSTLLFVSSVPETDKPDDKGDEGDCETYRKEPGIDGDPDDTGAKAHIPWTRESLRVQFGMEEIKGSRCDGEFRNVLHVGQ